MVGLVAAHPRLELAAGEPATPARATRLASAETGTETNGIP